MSRPDAVLPMAGTPDAVPAHATATATATARA